MGISSGVGIVSGLDREAIIQATMNVEKQPIILLQQKQASFSAKLSSYGSVKSALSGLQNAIKGLEMTSTFEPTYTASSGNKDILTVSSDDSAGGGTYNLIVSQLATSSQMTSNTYTSDTSTVGAGQLHFKVGDGDKQSVEITTEDKSLSDIATKINDADTDVLASVLKVADNDYRLTLTSKSTGRDIDFTYQEAGLTFTTDSKPGDTSGEMMKSEAFDSASTALNITGTLSVNGTDISLTGTETLNAIQASVDAIADTTATVELDATTGKYSLNIQSTTAEADVDLTFKDGDSSGGFSELIDNTKTQVAQLAEININGIDVIRKDNSIDDLITGITIDLVEADDTKTVSIDVSGKYSSAQEKLDEFVNAYNEIITTIEGLQSFNADSGQAGNLLGDNTTNLLKSGLRRMAFSTVDNIDGSVNNLSSLGITLEETGQLSFNSSTFTTAMEANKTEVTDFFTQTTSSNEGFAVGFDTFLDGYLKGTTGILDTKEDGYNNSIKKIDTDIESIGRRLATRETNLRNQYINLEQLLSNFSSTSSYLTNQLSVLTNMTNKIYK